MAQAALPYDEPDIITILVLASFLLLLNILGAALDSFFYCGLVGQILIGLAWGTPGARLLSKSFEEVATQLGYLGLILIVFEGGHSTSVPSVRKHLPLSICVAGTGVLVPIGFSFLLHSLGPATNLQEFAAGAALCSTSLGTTFSLLKATDLTTSRLGTVLTSAAMLDDVVGLIMVQVISNLGSNQSSFKAVTVLRPVLVSFGFALGALLICKYINLLFHLAKMKISVSPSNSVRNVLSKSSSYFVGSTSILIALVTATSYAGTSVLFAAYIAGASISWLEGNVLRQYSSSSLISSIPHVDGAEAPSTRSNCHPNAAPDDTPRDLSQDGDGSQVRRQQQEPTPPRDDQGLENEVDAGTTKNSKVKAKEQPSRSMRMYNDYYATPVERVLKPLFFVSSYQAFPSHTFNSGHLRQRSHEGAQNMLDTFFVQYLFDSDALLNVKRQSLHHQKRIVLSRDAVHGCCGTSDRDETFVPTRGLQDSC